MSILPPPTTERLSSVERSALSVLWVCCAIGAPAPVGMGTGVMESVPISWA